MSASALKKFAAASLLSAPLILGGCSLPLPRVTLCANGSIGQKIQTTVFNGVAAQACLVNGSALKENGNYFATGNVIVNGNLPTEASLSVSSGRVFINGNTGVNTRVSAKVPENTYVSMQYDFILKMYRSTQKFGSYTYPDETYPAVTVNGDVGAFSKIYSNFGVAIGGRLPANVDVRHARRDEHNVLTNPARITPPRL